MADRAKLSLAILDRIGAPLMTAVGDVASQKNNTGGAAPDTKAQAETLAALVGKSVQAGIALAGAMDLRDAGDADAVRLSLSAIAAPLIAARYSVSGAVPGDGDVRDIVTALEAVLTFADSFSAVPGAAQRLDFDAVPPDENQAALACIRAMVPVVGEIAAYSFGRPEKKLAQDIAARLQGEAATLVKAALPNADDGVRKAAELKLLPALAEIYAACHREHTKRILAMDEKSRQDAAQPHGGLLPMDPVWQAFELRAAMLAVLSEGAAATAAAPAAPPAPASPAAAAPPPQAAPATDANASPFSAFVKKPGAETPAAAEPAPPPTPPAAPAAPVPSPAEPPPAAPPAAPPAGDPENPMSFFAGGGKKKTDETGNSDQ